jgi:rhodanese-related sulfurtransferase
MTVFITAEQFKQRLQSGDPIELIDVRTPAEFSEAHVENARNLPLERLDPAALRADPGAARAKPLYVVCQKGGRGRQACEKLAAAGWTDVVNVEGGTLACEAAGLPIVRGKKTISLERQVRIAAGSLVLLGSALALLIHPYFVGLAAFIGGGLVFAGVTDTCGMALILARMPWNQVKLEAAAAPESDNPSCCAR